MTSTGDLPELNHTSASVLPLALVCIGKRAGDQIRKSACCGCAESAEVCRAGAECC